MTSRTRSIIGMIAGARTMVIEQLSDTESCQVCAVNAHLISRPSAAPYINRRCSELRPLSQRSGSRDGAARHAGSLEMAARVLGTRTRSRGSGTGVSQSRSSPLPRADAETRAPIQGAIPVGTFFTTARDLNA